MKYVVIDSTSKINLIKASSPRLSDGDILIKLKVCGVCGSDIGNIFGISSKRSAKIGHEISGIIHKVGRNTKDFTVGDRVFVHHHTSCMECHFCIHGNYTMCERYVDSLIPCGLAEEFIVPKWNVEHGSLLKIPDSITFEEAAMIEPLACCIRAWKKISIQKEDSIIIFGVGPIGTMHVMLGKIFELKKIFCIDPNEFRLNFSKKLGTITASKINKNFRNHIFKNTKNRGVDLIIIATSSLSIINESVDLIRKGGTILLFGEPPNNCILKINFSKIYSKEISLIPTYAASNQDIKSAFEMINKKSIDVAKLITHKFSINNSVTALNFVKNKTQLMKAIITSED